MKLSILICHLNNRKALLERLMGVLQPQVDAANGEVQVLVEADDGQLSTGAKRNILLEKAKSEFIAFHDDDDIPSPNYVSLILTAMDANPDADCVSLEGIMHQGGKDYRFSHSLRHGKEWRFEDNLYKRPPNHLNAVSLDLARQAGFPNLTIAEDKAYADRLFPLLKHEARVDPILYHYFP